MIHSLFAVLLTIGSPHSPCPDMTLELQPTTIEYGNDLPCAGFQASAGSVSYRADVRCPAFVLVTPAHNTPVYQKDCNTYTKPIGGKVDVTKQTYECKTSRFLFLIPIGTSCNLDSDAIVRQIPIYAIYPCMDLDDNTP